jgi:hypothetical protein
VQVGVEVALLFQVIDDLLATPAGPVMAGEEDVGIGGEELDRLVEVVRPDPWVADKGAARGEDVVHRAGGVVGDAENSRVGKVDVHLRRRLGPRHQLEAHPHAVDHLLLAGLDDVEVGRDQRDRAQ